MRMKTPLQATWSYKTYHIAQSEGVPVKSVNRHLVSELLGISGRYVSSIVPRRSDTLSYFYNIRDEEKGFLKIDLMFDSFSDIGFLGGCDLTKFPFERLQLIAEKYYQATNLSMPVLPAIAFGVFDDYGFYIVSLYGFNQIEPFFIKSSHQFLVNLFLSRFHNNQADLFKYIDLVAEGEDPLGLLALEPLTQSINVALPEESREAYYHQLGAELQKLISSSNKSKVVLRGKSTRNVRK